MSKKNAFAKWMSFLLLMCWIFIKMLLSAILITSPFVAVFACVTDLYQNLPAVMQGKLWLGWLIIGGITWLIMVIYSIIKSFIDKDK